MRKPPTPEAAQRTERRAKQAVAGRAAMVDYRRAERDRIDRIATLRKLRLEKSEHSDQ